MTLVKPAHASGADPPQGNYCVYSTLGPSRTCGFPTADAACGGIALPNGGCQGAYAGWIGGTSCPANSTGTTSCTCNDGYQPDSAGTSCVPDTCPVEFKGLDSALQSYEDGYIDMANETQTTRDGAACIAREARTRQLSPQIASGYRPPAYQAHIRDVYDKWQLLQGNNDAACAETKREVEIEFDKHSPFSHQPGNTSSHSSGRAVDIHLSDYSDADAIAAKCNMSRPVANDRSHFESPR